MKKIIKSGFVVLAVAAIAGYGTYSYFSDKETSTGNTFQAGSIDLKIDSTQHYNEMVCANVNGFGSAYVWIPESETAGTYTPALASTYNTTNPVGFPKAGTSCDGSWVATDLGATNQFFDFADLKPGDMGENTISLHVDNNPAWACAKITVTSDEDMTCTEPETEAGMDIDCVADPVGEAPDFDGEMGKNLSLAWWQDNGNNILEAGEEDTLFFLSGKKLNDLLAAGGTNNRVLNLTLADSLQNFFSDTHTDGQPLNGAQTYNFGLQWCFGDMAINGTTITCNGASLNNESQSDKITADMEFSVYQARNQETFRCADTYKPAGPTVGANLKAYQAPACTVTVQSNSSIQTVLNSAITGNVVCLAAGNHNNDTYPLSMNTAGVSLVGLGNAGDAILNGGVSINANNITVKGLTIKSSNITGENFGIYLNAGTTNATVTYNKLIGSGSSIPNSSGLLNVTNSGVSGLLFANNESTNWQRGIFLNPSANMTIEFNTLTGNAVGSANDNPTGNIIRKNHVTGNTAEGIGVFLGAGNSISVNQNNIFGNGGTANELNSYSALAVNAENNWWGDNTPLDEIGGTGSAQVDSDPFATSAFPQN